MGLKVSGVMRKHVRGNAHGGCKTCTDGSGAYTVSIEGNPDRFRLCHRCMSTLDAFATVSCRSFHEADFNLWLASKAVNEMVRLRKAKKPKS